MYIICLVCLTVSVDLPKDGETPLKVIKAIFCIINLIKMQNEQYMYMKAYFFHFWIFSIWFVLIDILFLWGVGVLCCQCLSAWAKDQDRFQQPTLGVFLSHYWTMIRTGSMWPPAPPAYVIIQTFRQSGQQTDQLETALQLIITIFNDNIIHFNILLTAEC